MKKTLEDCLKAAIENIETNSQDSELVKIYEHHVILARTNCSTTDSGTRTSNCSPSVVPSFETDTDSVDVQKLQDSAFRAALAKAVPCSTSKLESFENWTVLVEKAVLEKERTEFAHLAKHFVTEIQETTRSPKWSFLSIFRGKKTSTEDLQKETHTIKSQTAAINEKTAQLRQQCLEQYLVSQVLVQNLLTSFGLETNMLPYDPALETLADIRKDSITCAFLNSRVTEIEKLTERINISREQLNHKTNTLKSENQFVSAELSLLGLTHNSISENPENKNSCVVTDSNNVLGNATQELNGLLQMEAQALENIEQEILELKGAFDELTKELEQFDNTVEHREGSNSSEGAESAEDIALSTLSDFSNSSRTIISS